MDFIEWCDRVIATIKEMASASVDAQVYGIEDFEISQAIFIEDVECGKAIFDATRQLAAVGLLEDRSDQHWLLTEAGKRYVSKPYTFWNETCTVELSFPQEKELLSLVNRLSPQADENCVALEYVDHATLLENLAWAKDFATLRSYALRLEEIGFVKAEVTTGSVDLQATFRGLIWENRCIKSKVFLSYRRIDSEAHVIYFAEHLANYGIKPFLDTVSMEGTGQFPPEITQAITDCDVFLCFLGRTTFDSEWTRREIELAHTLKKPMIPIFQPDYESPKDDQPEYIKSLLAKGETINSGYFPQAVEKVADRIRQTWYQQFRK